MMRSKGIERMGLAHGAVLGVAVVVVATSMEAHGDDTLPDAWAQHVEWRSIGPANMSGRIVDLAVVESDPTTWWAATASGGLLKTINDGVTFTHQFEHERVVSIGDVTVAPSDPDIVWVGTGESNPRNSVSWGNGVYKSTDGGETWTHMGLEETFQIGRMQIHPENPDIVYVAALGRLWGTNPERGLYRTTDGGATWERVFYLDEETGVVDVQMHPEDPDTLMIAAYERQRDGFDTNDPAKKWGDGSGLYRSTDAGENWEKLTEGLPSCTLGRIGIDYYRANPDTVYVVLESEKIGAQPENTAYMGITGENAEVGARLMEVTEDGPAASAGLKVGDIVLRVDDAPVNSYDDLIAEIRRHLAGETVRVEVSRDREPVSMDVTFERHPDMKEDTDAGKDEEESDEDAPTLRPSPFRGRLGGQAANVQDQQGEDGHEYGGVYKSTDGGDTWKRINSVNPRPMYFSQIRVDPSNDDHIYVLGVQLYRSSDNGETFTADGARGGVHVDHHAMWIDPDDGRHIILGNDGGLYVTNDRMQTWDHRNRTAIGQFYHASMDTRIDYSVYGGLQDNGSWGAKARGRSGGAINEDWFRIGSGDGFVCRADPNDPDLLYYESQNGGLGRRHLKTGDGASLRPRAPRGMQYRFNWRTPFILSHHNSKVYYTAGNYVMRSLDRGNDLQRISAEITATDRGSATALTESPRDQNVLYVGTDDGAVWGTRDGGTTWRDLYAPTEPGPDDADEGTEASGPLTGTWMCEALGEIVQREQREFKLAIALDEDGAVSGEISSSQLAGPITNASFDAESGELIFQVSSDDLVVNVSATVNANAMTGNFRVGSMFTVAFEGERQIAPSPEEQSTPDGTPLNELVPERRWVSSLQASRFSDARVYMTLDGHRSDDDACHAFISEDYGMTWRSLTDDLPEDAGSARVLREDRTRADMLYLGTEFGIWVTIDGGKTWTSLNTNLPTVAIHAIDQHISLNDLLVGTHGRSLWIADITMLRQLTPDVINSGDGHLFTPSTARYWLRVPSRGRHHQAFSGENPPEVATIEFVLPRGVRDPELSIVDATGTTIRRLAIDASSGYQRMRWNMRRTPRGEGRRRFGRRVPPGDYAVVLEFDDQRLVEPLRIEGDPTYPDVILWGDEYDARLEAAAQHEEEDVEAPAFTGAN